MENTIVPKGTKINWAAFVQYESNKDAFHKGSFILEEDKTPQEIESLLSHDYGHYDCRFVDVEFTTEG